MTIHSIAVLFIIHFCFPNVSVICLSVFFCSDAAWILFFLLCGCQCIIIIVNQLFAIICCRNVWKFLWYCYRCDGIFLNSSLCMSSDIIKLFLKNFHSANMLKYCKCKHYCILASCVYKQTRWTSFEVKIIGQSHKGLRHTDLNSFICCIFCVPILGFLAYFF